jgi:hypothetical protein
MTLNDKMPDWPAVEAKLKRENKGDLIQLIRELTAVSPEVERFIETRFLKKKNLQNQIAPYHRVIQEQFVISDWNNSVSWSFAGVQKVIDDYAQSSQGDNTGICELLLVALETAVSFADSINLQDNEFDAEITELAERFVVLFTDEPQKNPQYLRRLKKVERTGNELGFYALGDTLDELTNPHR